MGFLDKGSIGKFYENYANRIVEIKKKLQRPLTYTEKILFTHLTSQNLELTKGKNEVSLQVDRVAMQDATAQMAALQFMLTGRNKVAVPTTIHCDHLIAAKLGAEDDLQEAVLENNEVYQFLRSVANKYGMGFWKPGSGIIHQVVLENYAVPGMLMIGTDSHTPNAGGLGMVAIGVGGADAVDVMAGEKWNLMLPKIIGVQLKGKLSGWTASKDVILKVAEILTVKGGTGSIVEYFGEGARSISATGKATITNMGAEVGATTSLFPYDKHTEAYLRATGRDFVADSASSVAGELKADREVEENPQQFYDELIVIDLDKLEPHIVGPHTPDLARPVSKIGEEAHEKDWPVELSSCLIGSCTNSSYEDMGRAASIAAQAVAHGVRAKIPFMVTPGSEQIHQTIKRDGQLEVFEKIGGVVLANACGPCIGQWKREDAGKNSIITSYNRNFKKRQDANPDTHAFIGSPEIVTAYALSGTFDFDPRVDELEAADGTKFKLEAPKSSELPSSGFVFAADGFQEPSGAGEVIVDGNSERLALLEPFTAWDKEKDFRELFVLVKAKGKCTTDHISPAGKWLKFRGHLDNISNNMYSGAVNYFSGEVGRGKDQLSGSVDDFNQVARNYKNSDRGWVVIGDANYGEGSSREHAAMEPRHLGCRAVIAKSFARIAETNLKKQGVLPLWFVNVDDYDKILEADKITIVDPNVKFGEKIELLIEHQGGSTEYISARHTLTPQQIEWFNSGSALEWIRNKNG